MNRKIGAHICLNTHLVGAAHRTIQSTAPFTLADRETDYRVAWAHFAKMGQANNVPSDPSQPAESHS